MALSRKSIIQGYFQILPSKSNAAKTNMCYHTKYITSAKIPKNLISESVLVSFQASSKYARRQTIKPGIHAAMSTRWLILGSVQVA